MQPLEKSAIMPAPVSAELNIPSRIPLLPGSMLQRFGTEAEEFNEQLERFWRRVQLNLSEAFEQQVAVPQNQAAEEMEQLTARYETDTATLTAAINEEKIVRANADSALALRASSLEASIDTPDTGLLARVATIEGAYVDETGAEAIFALKLLAELTGPTGSIYAAIDEESTTRANADSALAERTSDLEASIDTPTTGLLARVTTIESAYVDASGAEAIAQSEITAALTGPSGSIYAAVEVEANARVAADGLIHARWGVSIDINGNIVGRINLDGTNGSSEFSVDVGKFTVANSSLGIVPFQIVGSKARFTSDVEIDGSLLLTGSLTLAQISDAGALAGEDDVDYSAITGTKPPSNADVTLAAINGGLSVTGAGITLASGSPAIKAGQTAYDTGTGFFLGLASGSPRFSIGNSSGNKLTWDGSTLSIVGDLTLTNTITLSKISDAGALAALNSVNLASGEVTNKSLANLDGAASSKLAGIASNADVTLAAVEGMLTIGGGGITLNAAGVLRGGASNFSTGTGFFLGYEGGAYKFRVGNPAGARIEWDGSTWNVVSFPGGSAPTYTITLINGETSNPLYAPTGGGSYTIGQRVNINAITPVEPGAKNFTHWSGVDSAVNALDSATSSNTYVTVIGDMTLTANYS